jgi:DNA-binding MarR family transcriptional regulator
VGRSEPTDVDLPTLLRLARGGYGNTIAAHLGAAGFDDLPRNGPFLIAALAAGRSSAELSRGLGVSRQAASQLVETLVLRRYLCREVDPADRRRMTLTLTDRGSAAAAVIRAGTEEVDATLARMLSPAQLAGLRAGLVALGQIREQTDDDHR